MTHLVFDCETAPLPEDELLALLPPFDPFEVKFGNLKDPDKISAKIAEAEANHKANFIERAALSPLTGRVLAIGIKEVGAKGVIIIGQDNEAELLQSFWDACRGVQGRLWPLIGFNSHLFDLPFLFKRSWKHGIVPPAGYRNGRYWNNSTDLRDVWQMGDREARGSLDAIAKHLGLAGKTGSGADFGRLWLGTAEEKQVATDYLVNDVRLTEKVAHRMGAIPTATLDALDGVE